MDGFMGDILDKIELAKNGTPYGRNLHIKSTIFQCPLRNSRKCATEPMKFSNMKQLIIARKVIISSYFVFIL